MFTVVGMHLPAHGFLLHSPRFLLPLLGSRARFYSQPRSGGIREQRLLFYPHSEDEATAVPEKAPSLSEDALRLVMKWDPGVSRDIGKTLRVQGQVTDREAVECALISWVRNLPVDIWASLDPARWEMMQRIVQACVQADYRGSDPGWMASMVWKTIENI